MLVQYSGFPSSMVPQDLALKTADAHGAIYVLSQDPDSDRFCAAEKKYIDF